MTHPDWFSKKTGLGLDRNWDFSVGFVAKDSQMDKDFIIGIGKLMLLKAWHMMRWLKVGTSDFHQH